MNCPICKQPLVFHTLLESQLPAYQCPQCEGCWISANEYLRWLQTQGPQLPPKLEPDPNVPTWDTPQLKVCPGCGHFLIRYRVLPHVQFYLDRCGHCNGVWLDKGELEVLVAHNLQDKINQLFTQPWQTRIQEEEAHAALDKMYLERFGAADYKKAQEIREWLLHHPQRAMLLAYLKADNPYKL